MQVYWISNKQNFLANILSRSQYIKIVIHYLLLKIVLSILKIRPKTIILKYHLNNHLLDYFGTT